MSALSVKPRSLMHASHGAMHRLQCQCRQPTPAIARPKRRSVVLRGFKDLGAGSKLFFASPKKSNLHLNKTTQKLIDRYSGNLKQYFEEYFDQQIGGKFDEYKSNVDPDKLQYKALKKLQADVNKGDDSKLVGELRRCAGIAKAVYAHDTKKAIVKSAAGSFAGGAVAGAVLSAATGGFSTPLSVAMPFITASTATTIKGVFDFSRLMPRYRARIRGGLHNIFDAAIRDSYNQITAKSKNAGQKPATPELATNNTLVA